MKLDDSIDQALRSSEPIRKLREMVQERFAQGADKQAMLALLENVRQELRQAGRDADEDAVMEVMDFLVGWCSPHMKLEPQDGRKPHTNGVSVSSENDDSKKLGLAEGAATDGER